MPDEWEKTIIPLSHNDERYLPDLGKERILATRATQAKATWGIAFESGARSRDAEVAELTRKGEELCCL